MPDLMVFRTDMRRRLVASPDAEPTVPGCVEDDAQRIFNLYKATVIPAIDPSTLTDINTVWVDAENGDDVNPGSQAAPKQTIAAGTQLVGAFTHVALRGVFYERLEVNPFSGGNANRNNRHLVTWPGQIAEIHPPEEYGPLSESQPGWAYPVGDPRDLGLDIWYGLGWRGDSYGFSNSEIRYYLPNSNAQINAPAPVRNVFPWFNRNGYFIENISVIDPAPTPLPNLFCIVSMASFYSQDPYITGVIALIGQRWDLASITYPGAGTGILQAREFWKLVKSNLDGYWPVWTSNEVFPPGTENNALDVHPKGANYSGFSVAHCQTHRWQVGTKYLIAVASIGTTNGNDTGPLDTVNPTSLAWIQIYSADQAAGNFASGEFTLVAEWQPNYPTINVNGARSMRIANGMCALISAGENIYWCQPRLSGASQINGPHPAGEGDLKVSRQGGDFVDITIGANSDNAGQQIDDVVEWHGYYWATSRGKLYKSLDGVNAWVFVQGFNRPFTRLTVCDGVLFLTSVNNASQSRVIYHTFDGVTFLNDQLPQIATRESVHGAQIYHVNNRVNSHALSSSVASGFVPIPIPALRPFPCINFQEPILSWPVQTTPNTLIHVDNIRFSGLSPAGKIKTGTALGNGIKEIALVHNEFSDFNGPTVFGQIAHALECIFQRSESAIDANDDVWGRDTNLIIPLGEEFHRTFSVPGDIDHCIFRFLTYGVKSRQVDDRWLPIPPNAPPPQGLIVLNYRHNTFYEIEGTAIIGWNLLSKYYEPNTPSVWEPAYEISAQIWDNLFTRVMTVWDGGGLIPDFDYNLVHGFIDITTIQNGPNNLLGSSAPIFRLESDNLRLIVAGLDYLGNGSPPEIDSPGVFASSEEPGFPAENIGAYHLIPTELTIETGEKHITLESPPGTSYAIVALHGNEIDGLKYRSSFSTKEARIFNLDYSNQEYTHERGRTSHVLFKLREVKGVVWWWPFAKPVPGTGLEYQRTIASDHKEWWQKSIWNWHFWDNTIGLFNQSRNVLEFETVDAWDSSFETYQLVSFNIDSLAPGAPSVQPSFLEGFWIWTQTGGVSVYHAFGKVVNTRSWPARATIQLNQERGGPYPGGVGPFRFIKAFWIGAVKVLSFDKATNKFTFGITIPETLPEEVYESFVLSLAMTEAITQFINDSLSPPPDSMYYDPNFTNIYQSSFWIKSTAVRENGYEIYEATPIDPRNVFNWQSLSDAMIADLLDMLETNFESWIFGIIDSLLVYPGRDAIENQNPSVGSRDVHFDHGAEWMSGRADKPLSVESVSGESWGAQAMTLQQTAPERQILPFKNFAITDSGG